MLCEHFIKGHCKFGDKCRDEHDKSVCRDYYFKGDCRRGPSCKFHHVERQSEEKKEFEENPKRRRKNKRNTETFEPHHEPADMRVLVPPEVTETCQLAITPRDVVLVHGLFGNSKDLSLYDRLLEEIKATGKMDENLFVRWHGNTHWIADDHVNWKSLCPTFGEIIRKFSEYFNMNIKATRLNWYKDTSDHKPLHFDAAAVKPEKALTQNFTVALTLGSAVREVLFENAKTRSTLSIPLVNGSVYAFARDVNFNFRHGIPQIHPRKFEEKPRFSIIAWGAIKFADE
jgi:hypothetical protein